MESGKNTSSMSKSRPPKRTKETSATGAGRASSSRTGDGSIFWQFISNQPLPTVGSRVAMPRRHSLDSDWDYSTFKSDKREKRKGQGQGAAVLAILYFLRSTCTYFNIRASSSIIQYHLDNMEALRRLNTTESFFATANPITTDQYDIWAAIHEATSSTSRTHIGTHVKGHQDDDNPLESLPPEAHMNIRMDRIAGDCRTSHPSPLAAKAHLGNQGSLTLNGQIVTTKLHRQLHCALTGPFLKAYIQLEETWDDYLFSMLDWKA